LIAHVAYVGADGVAQCLPMAFGRREETLYLHGAVANAHLQALLDRRCSLTFTLVDGLVMARSAFHHSMNYRCAVVVGNARLVTAHDEKFSALTAVLEHACPGRSAECIGMTESEVRRTKVIAIDVTEAVAKLRQGPPVDETTDVESDSVFAGVVNLEQRVTGITRDPTMKRSHAVPSAVAHYVHRHSGPIISEVLRGELLLSSDPSRIDRVWLHRVLGEQSYWANAITQDRLYTSLEHSLTFGVYLEYRQVAFARVLTDVTRVGYIGDVFVEEEFRGKGYATALLEFMLEHPSLRGCERLMLATRDAQAFYAKFGFQAPIHEYLVRRAPRP
jgi:nitroimidazol reductase NimA-like FMN-containing flavoprotein (pyridoxamine 5'-phosphate oxidase superfamily)/GNAT superfamily N-acetyltransferase